MTHSWVMTPESLIPPFAVMGEIDRDGFLNYVDRSFHEVGPFPSAGVVSKKNCAYISWKSSQIEKTDYKILVGENYAAADGEEPLLDSYEVLVCKPKQSESSILDNNVLPNKAQNQISAEKASQSHIWVSSTLDNIPPNAVVAGREGNVERSIIYVGRAYHEGETLPAKVIPDRNIVYVSRDGVDIPILNEFEVLVGDGYSWVECPRCGDIPPGAVSTGQTKNGERVYVGRGPYFDPLTLGKVFRLKYCVFITFYHKEHKIDSFEILVKN